MTDRGETVKGWWRDPLTKAPPGNQIVEMHTLARLLARQPANAHARSRPSPVRHDRIPPHRLDRHRRAQGHRPEDVRDAGAEARRPRREGLRCTAWVDMRGRVVRFDEDLAYPDGSEYRSVTSLTGFDDPLPVHPPATTR
ncbi:hypothetical protein E4K10_40935 [Streptomyces sp. T1317-0309]|nr:hypothetical protein E4K10_40935 [Streptomyces sp. T1317-0309]